MSAIVLVQYIAALWDRSQAKLHAFFGPSFQSLDPKEDTLATVQLKGFIGWQKIAL